MVRLSPDPSAKDPKKARSQNILLLLGVVLGLMLLAYLFTNFVLPYLEQKLASTTTEMTVVVDTD